MFKPLTKCVDIFDIKLQASAYGQLQIVNLYLKITWVILGRMFVLLYLMKNTLKNFTGLLLARVIKEASALVLAGG